MIARRAFSGDLAAQWELALVNARFAYKMTGIYVRPGLALEDLFCVALNALFEVAGRFDARAIRFVDYAQMNVRRRLANHVVEFVREVRLPVRVEWPRRDLLKLVDSDKIESMEPEKTGELVGVGTLTGRALELFARAPLALDAASQGDPTGAPMGSLVPDESAVTPLEDMQASEQTGDLAALLGALPPREQDVLRSRFGLDGEVPQTLEEIARRLAVTRERVRQIEFKALRHVREFVRRRDTDRARQPRRRGSAWPPDAPNGGDCHIDSYLHAHGGAHSPQR